MANLLGEQPRYIDLKKLSKSKKETSPYFLTCTEILNQANSHPDSVLNFRMRFYESAENLNTHELFRKMSNEIYDDKSGFCSGNASDAIFEMHGNHEVYGASFTKPDRYPNADLIYSRGGNILIVADGSTMVAKPETNSNFPKLILEKCTDAGQFMPDVLWTTMLSVLLGKENYSSPFMEKVKKFIDKNNILQKHITSINLETDPSKIIETINQATGIFLKGYFGIEVNEETKKFVPSGILGVVNTTTKKWATVGDVKIGYTSDKDGKVLIVNNHNKVDNFDRAVLGAVAEDKEALVSARTTFTGNIQGLDVEIETGDFPEIVDSPRTNNKRAILIWSDGAGMPLVDENQLKGFFSNFPSEISKKVSFTGTLMARNPFLYIPYLLHSQNKFVKNLVVETAFSARHGNKITFKLKKMKEALWRADEASFIVSYE